MIKETKNKLNLLIIVALLLGIGLACGSENTRENGEKTDTKSETAGKPKKLESYSFKGLTFSYYLIKKDLSRKELIAVVGEIHAQEPDAQLILLTTRPAFRIILIMRRESAPEKPMSKCRRNGRINISSPICKNF